MRREGFEVQISSPEVIYKDIDGKKCEPFELLTLDVDQEYQGIAVELLGKRKAVLQQMIPYGDGKIKMEFEIPARGLIGFRSQFITNTRGTGLMNHRFLAYEPYAGPIPRRTKGAMISMENGAVTAYALDGLQPRGVLFVDPTTQVYEGMIVGEHARDNDLDVNPTKKKKLTNMRASGSDDAVKLAPPKKMTLEDALEWINNDELIEVTYHVNRILSNPKNRKVFHNAKYDIKFLMTAKIKVVNPVDTVSMQHFVDETVPKSLKQLVKLYFPEYLETL